MKKAIEILEKHGLDADAAKEAADELKEAKLLVYKEEEGEEGEKKSNPFAAKDDDEDEDEDKMDYEPKKTSLADARAKSVLAALPDDGEDGGDEDKPKGKNPFAKD